MTKTNYILFAIGIITIVIGYVFLSIGPATNFYSLSLAPIILLIGYVVILPIAILYRKKS
jgi:hypothetical protein